VKGSAIPKKIAAGQWAIQNADYFSSGLREVSLEGDDAYTNGTATGALLGARFCFAGIPEDWFTGLLDAEGLLLRFKRLEPFLIGWQN